MNENWARWEKQVVNGIFPLRRSLQTSDHSAVFLTEHKTKDVPDALLKLVPAIPTLKDAQLAHWSLAARMPHPYLVRLLDTGSCQLEGLEFLFVVTEYAEQTLAQILLQRALAPQELRKMLRPLLEALSFLHRKHLVHGGLKPSNLLMVKDRLKLASDAVRPAGESTASIAPPSVFDPPESRDGSSSTAGDVWSLGVLIVEALTQKRPVWPDKSAEAVLPETLPAPFVAIVRRCLNRNPAHRPSVEELDARINPTPRMYLVPSSRAERAPPAVGLTPAPVLPPPPVVYPEPEAERQPQLKPRPKLQSEPEPESQSQPQSDPKPQWQPQPSPQSQPTALADRPPNRHSFLVGAALIVTVVLGTAWGGVILLSSGEYLKPAASSAANSRSAGTSMSASSGAMTPSPGPGLVGLAAAAEPVAATVPAMAAVPDEVIGPRSVLHEELPDVPQRAIETIHGRMLFAVRVTVDRSGTVIRAAVAGTRSSKYFARLSGEAARKWRFAPADNLSTRKWLLQFEFTRAGVTVRAS
jgi:serine/threonine protein kinase